MHRIFPVLALRARASAIVLACAACAPLPPQPTVPLPARQSTAPAQQNLSPNFDARRPNFVILHHTTNANVEQSLRVLTDPARRVSAHYLIGRDGRIIELVEPGARAWHAGDSYWGGHSDINSASIGIEIDNNGREPFPDSQMEALLSVLAEIKARFNIPTANFIGHSDIAPGRKVDPSRYFPWKRLADNGYGMWCDPPYPSAPPGLDPVTLLQAFGYNVWNVDAAISAFKLHFAPDDPSPQLTERDRSMLYCLVLQKRALAAQ
jgi:N-acetylmuramoyl-L-alanine amidase